MLHNIKRMMLVLVVAAVAFAGCKKDKDPEVSAVITVAAPTEQAVVAYGEEIQMIGTIEVSGGSLHGYKLMLREAGSGTELFTKDERSGNLSGTIHFDENWKNIIPHDAEVTFEVEALLDERGRSVRSSVSFRCEAADVAPPVITIHSPQSGDTYHHQDEVHITGKIEWTQTLHGYELIIRKVSDGTVVFSKDDHVHDKVITFDERWTNDLDDHTDLELEVITALDHDGATFSEKVSFHCHGSH